jgi:predicted  nucleic acid-binding Zn ribbon protein
MTVAQVKFGRAGDTPKDTLRDMAESYLSTLLKGGQIFGDYMLAWNNDVLTAHVQLAAPDAFAKRHHSEYAIKELAKIKTVFRRGPIWALLDDNRSKNSKWENAPFLYMHGHAFNNASPISSGENGRVIPIYMFPISSDQREQLYFWLNSYYYHDRLWFESGALEIPAYRQMVDPNSELAKKGRGLCQLIEKMVKLPTYYYLQRYWSRVKQEDQRKCSGCGGKWRTEYADVPSSAAKPFYHFDFRCDKCRLVSHIGVSTDGGAKVRIGEFSKNRR